MWFYFYHHIKGVKSQTDKLPRRRHLTIRQIKKWGNTWNSLKMDEIDESVAIEQRISSFRAFIWYESEETTKKSSKYGEKREGIALANTWMLQRTCKGNHHNYSYLSTA